VLNELVEVSYKLDSGSETLLPERILEHFFYSLDDLRKVKVSNLLYEIFTGSSLEDIAVPEELSEVSFTFPIPKVFTVTANPIFDFIIDIKNLPERNYQVGYAGKGTVVTMALKNLGVTSIPFGFSGGNRGNFFTRLFQKNQVPTEYLIPIEEESRQATFLHSVEPQIFLMTESLKVADSKWDELVNKLFETVSQDDILVLSGSLSPYLPEGSYTRIIKEAKERGIVVLLDTRGEPLKEGIKAGPFAITPNLQEFFDLVEVDLKELRGNAETIVQEAKKVTLYTGTEVVIVTLGAEGAILVTKDVAFHAYPLLIDEEDVQIEVYPGDTLMAGFIYAYFLQESTLGDLKEALKFGVAAGTAKVLLPMAVLPELENINKVLYDVEIEELPNVP